MALYRSRSSNPWPVGKTVITITMQHIQHKRGYTNVLGDLYTYLPIRLIFILLIKIMLATIAPGPESSSDVSGTVVAVVVVVVIITAVKILSHQKSAT